MSQLGSENLTFYGGVGNAGGNIPIPQALPDKYKGETWKKDTLDIFESIGIKQFHENLKYTDYYKMVEGTLVYSDLLDESPDLLKDIRTLREELELPTYLQHYDIIGEAVNTIVGEWMQTKDKFRFDTVDEVSQNEYIRDKTEMLKEFAQKAFELELNKRLLSRGIDPNPQFKSEEEQIQHQQILEQQIKELFPEKVEERMKNWKTMASEWAEKTWARDYQRFYMEEIERKEAIDILLTGRAPRHYVLGYDYYKPESWSPINTFHSKDPDLKYYQDAEYVGRVMFMPFHQIIDRYGHRLSLETTEKLSELFSGKYKPSAGRVQHGSKDLENGKWFSRETVPFKGYADYKMQLQFQDALDTPLGEFEDNDGNKFARWLPSLDGDGIYRRRGLAKKLRTDEDVRGDVFQVTEVYFKGYKQYGILSYRAETGYLETVEVDEDLLPEFKEKYEIKDLKKVSLKEAKENPEENTIAWYYVPKVYYGLKINTNGGTLKDIYVVEELPFQIKGDSEIYDIKLPVCGVITSSMAQRMRPYQVKHNLVLNQNANLIEKELGAFLIYDVNFLPSEFLELSGDGKDVLAELHDTINELGILPVDTSKRNMMEKGGTQFNTFMQQDLSFTGRIQRNIELANFYKEEALNQIGITPQRRGAPTQYTTAEGVRVGQNATYAKTEGIYQTLLYDKQRKMEVHLAIAQYCQLNNKDSSYLFRASDGELEFLKSIEEDESFALRQISITPVMSSAKAKQFEMAKNVLMQRNTTGTDDKALVDLIFSDDYLEMRQVAYEGRLYMQAEAEKQRQHEAQLQERQVAEMKEAEDRKYELEYAKLETSLERERIESLGESGRSEDNTKVMQEVNKEADRAIKERQFQAKQALDMEKLNQTIVQNGRNINLQLEKLKLEKEKNQLKKEEIEMKRFTSTINKN